MSHRQSSMRQCSHESQSGIDEMTAIKGASALVIRFTKKTKQRFLGDEVCLSVTFFVSAESSPANATHKPQAEKVNHRG
ncbi:hypothetical protein BaRGS_00033749 [Batillaria attramentaria]|uniref:Uncharacterized protein n=1 Tax=Batillaria attramentaria TaxID=370345 RepID=A0ABD0JJ71_9CAEN